MVRKKLGAGIQKFLPHEVGFGFWGLNLNWALPASDHEVVRAFVVQLEDRRALYNPYNVEVEGDVSWSVKGIREFASTALEKLSPDSPAAFAVSSIRRACRRYDETSRNEFPNVMRTDGNAGWLIALGELRSTVGYHLRQLERAYGIDVESELASIMPSINEDPRIEPH